MAQLSDNQVAVYNRLTELQISNYNQHRHIVEVLGNAVAPGEVIEAVVIGRNSNNTPALFALTVRRLFYIEGDRLYHSTNQVSLVSLFGVTLLPTPILSSVTIQTQAGEYAIMDANNSNARLFTQKINEVINQFTLDETSQEEDSQPNSDMTATSNNVAINSTTPAPNAVTEPKATPAPATPIQTGALPADSPDIKQLEKELEPPKPIEYSPQQANFIKANYVGSLSTANASGQIHSSPVYYVFFDNIIHILTRENTHKAQNMSARPQATLTILNYQTLNYVTVEALAKEMSNLAQMHLIYEKINSIIESNPDLHIQQALYDTSEGNYTVFGLLPRNIKSNITD